MPTFEKLNPDISINVLCKGDEGGYVPLYVSKERNRRHHVNLFLLEEKDEHGNKVQHYIWIKDLSRLVCGRTNHQHRTYVCNHCLHPFWKQEVLERHTPNCERHPPEHVKYPNSKNPKKCIAKFCNLGARFRLPFYLVCDFESFLSPLQDENVDAVKATRLIDEQKVCGFACHRVTKYPEYQTQPVVYSGPDVMEYFYKHLMSESANISKIVSEPKDMLPLTEQEQTDYDTATTCTVCTKAFEPVNPKVKHHDHIDGKYICAACNNCNLTLKYPNRKRKATEGHRKNKNDRRKRKLTEGRKKTKKKKFELTAVDDEEDMCDEEDVKKENEQYETNFFPSCFIT